MEYEEKRLMIIELGKQNTPMKEIAAFVICAAINATLMIMW